MQITITQDKQRLAEATVQALLQHFPSARTIALPTGRTFVPEVYRRIADLCNDGEISFGGKAVVLLDEFYPIDPDDPRSNRAYLERNLFSHVKTKPERIVVPSIETAPLIDAAMIDVLMAGLGSNGHVANNEPGSSKDSPTRIVDLTPETIAASDAPTPRAITLGLRAILAAKVVIVAASGANKARAAYRAFRQPVTDRVPASHLQHYDGILHVILDEAAAKMLKSEA